MRHIVILSAGFAGSWSAVGAARKLDELGISSQEIRITVVSCNPWHNIRVRNYERDLRDARIALDDMLGPIRAERITAEVLEMDFARQRVLYSSDGRTQSLPYERLVFAFGSRLIRPSIPGAELVFDADTSLLSG
jgi:NADH:ubiquinone reductase (H+-translocating)